MKVAHEVALDEFARIAQAYDLELDENNVAVKSITSAIVAAIESGQVTVDEKGHPAVHLKYPVGEISSFKFQELTAQALVALGDEKNTNSTTKDWKTLADMTGQPAKLFQEMRLKPDFRLCQKFILLFLA